MKTKCKKIDNSTVEVTVTSVRQKSKKDLLERKVILQQDIDCIQEEISKVDEQLSVFDEP